MSSIFFIPFTFFSGAIFHTVYAVLLVSVVHVVNTLNYILYIVNTFFQKKIHLVFQWFTLCCAVLCCAGHGCAVLAMAVLARINKDLDKGTKQGYLSRF